MNLFIFIYLFTFSFIQLFTFICLLFYFLRPKSFAAPSNTNLVFRENNFKEIQSQIDNKKNIKSEIKSVKNILKLQNNIQNRNLHDDNTKVIRDQDRKIEKLKIDRLNHNMTVQISPTSINNYTTQNHGNGPYSMFHSPGPSPDTVTHNSENSRTFQNIGFDSGYFNKGDNSGNNNNNGGGDNYRTTVNGHGNNNGHSNGSRGGIAGVGGSSGSGSGSNSNNGSNSNSNNVLRPVAGKATTTTLTINTRHSKATGTGPGTGPGTGVDLSISTSSTPRSSYSPTHSPSPSPSPSLSVSVSVSPSPAGQYSPCQSPSTHSMRRAVPGARGGQNASSMMFGRE